MEESQPINMEQQTAEDKLINDAFQHLLDTYLASPHRRKVDIITKAFNFAKEAHKGVKRLSGEPYILHPIAVAQIASEEMGLGSTSICSALLHDVVEDTDYTVVDINNIFGPKIAQIVSGLTKISGGIFGDHASAQAENFKKLLLTMSDDIRVILIKICDRLHNMRTLESQPANKQYKIAGETLYIYAPLAHRLGLNKIKSELENLSFRFEHPDVYADISKRLSLTKEQRDRLFEQFTEPIRKTLDEMGIDYEIMARVKTPYSIWSKMQNKNLTFDEIYDILAVRIIFKPKERKDEINECFNIYVAISQIFRAHPNRMRDWLNHPKANGYQALHVTLMSKQGRWIEVQIRSDHMHEVAEKGFAAHWKYKDGDDSVGEEGELNNWLSTIREILDDPQPDAMDFLDAIKLNLFASEIFVFTPKGEIKTMPVGSTALDFAFQIHTFLGSHCIGAKVNHKLVPLSHKLNSGDQVEILASKTQHVEPNWINFVNTAKAKAKLQAIIRKQVREVQRNGEEKLTTWLHEHEMELTTSVLDTLCTFHELQKHENLLYAIGKGNIMLTDKDFDELNGKKKKKNSSQGSWRKYVPFISYEKKREDTLPATRDKLVVGKDFNKKIPCVITEETYQMYIFPQCCHPIPGDDILGFIDNKKQVEIHKRNCPVASKLKTSFGNRLLDAKWDMHRLMVFEASVIIRGIDRKGMLHDVADVITEQMDINIRRVTISSNEGIFEGTIDLHVHDRDEVRIIMENLKRVEGMHEVQQVI